MSDQQANEQPPKPWRQVFLGVLAVAMLSGGLVGPLNGLPQSVAISAFIIGAFLAVLATFWERVEGQIGLTKDGFGVGVTAAGEEKLEQGTTVVGAGKVAAATEAVQEAIQEAVSRFGTPTSAAGTPTVTKGALPPGTSPKGRNIQIIEDAVVALSTLAENERIRTQAEIVRMNHLDFDERSDPKAIRAGDHGHSYRVHKVPGTSVRLWYRPLDEEEQPGTFVIIAVEQRG